MSGLVNEEEWEFVPVWKQNLDQYRESIIALWRDHAKLPGDEIQKRLSQVILVVRFKGQTIGISTAYIQNVKLLNNHQFLFYRFYIIPQCRMPGLDIQISKKSVAILEAAFPQIEDQLVKGVIMVVENAQLAKLPTIRKAVGPNIPFVFIGNTSAGHPIRVYYFKGAVI